MDFVKRSLQRDLGLSLEEINANMDRLRVGMRPLTADSIPFVGPMKHFPNVVINCGYGYMGFQAIGLSKVVEGIIEDNDAGKELPKKVIQANLVSRVGI